MEVYLIRHTTPEIDKNICYGQSDISLAGSFLSEAEGLVRKLPAPDAVYSSPMKRCLELAQLIGKEKQVIHDLRLQEMNFGDWEMKKWTEIDQLALNKWMDDFVNIRVPNGENFIALNERVIRFIHELQDKNYGKAAIITHAGVIRCFTAAVLEIPLKNAFKIPCDFGSVTKINLNNDNSLNKVDYFNKVF